MLAEHLSPAERHHFSPPHPARETLHAERGALSTSTESTERRGLCSGPLAGWHSGGGVGSGWGAGEPEAHTRSGM